MPCDLMPHSEDSQMCLELNSPPFLFPQNEHFRYGALLLLWNNNVLLSNWCCLHTSYMYCFYRSG